MRGVCTERRNVGQRQPCCSRTAPLQHGTRPPTGCPRPPPTAEELFARIASCGGPSLNSTVTPEAVCAESGRLLARAAAASPTLAAAGDAVAAAAWSAAAAEAEAAHSEGSGEVEAEAEEAGGAATPASEPAAGIAAGVGKL